MQLWRKWRQRLPVLMLINSRFYKDWIMSIGSVLQTREIVVRIIDHPASKTFIQTRGTGKIALTTATGTQFVRFEDVSYCQAEGNYCSVALLSGKSVLLSKTLKWVEAHLPADRFIRVHASFLVSAIEVTSQKGDCLWLESGTKIPMSRSKRKEVLNRLKREKTCAVESK